MSDIYDNAIHSIQLGIEDFQSNDDRRPVSALRNFYAGVLLLGKACLIQQAPKADPMELIAARFEPVPGDDGDVDHTPMGYVTVDLEQLKRRFKKFKLAWPSGDIQRLQKLRNDFEHFHSAAPTETIRQAIASCFPLVQGFFQILGKDPATELGSAWEAMLAEKEFYRKQKKQCESTFQRLPWAALLTNTDGLSCDECQSSLIYQVKEDNDDPTCIEGKCLGCAVDYSAEDTIRLILDAEYGADDYVAIKDGGDRIIHDCPECAEEAYVVSEDIDRCFYCNFAVSGECGRCMTTLTVNGGAKFPHAA